MYSTHNHLTSLRDEGVEEGISSLLERLRSRLSGSLSSGVEIYLGGGYGRGEGGVHYDAQGYGHAYNDLDFFVFTEGFAAMRRRRLARFLESVGRELSHETGAQIDFGPPTSMSSLCREGGCLMYQELRVGHVLVLGSGRAIRRLPVLAPGEISPHEGIRLLWNRGMGLLLAGERLCGMGDQELDFIVRNIHKGVLGAGDAELLRLGRYRWSVGDRLEALSAGEAPLWSAQDAELYAGAVGFKRRPSVSWDAGEALQAWKEVCGLWCREVECFAGASGAGLSKGLESFGRSAGRRRLRECLRRLWRMGVGGLGRDFCLDPVYGLLSELYVALGAGLSGCMPAPARLHRLWRHFT